MRNFNSSGVSSVFTFTVIFIVTAQNQKNYVTCSSEPSVSICILHSDNPEGQNLNKLKSVITYIN
jgi:hypothetical protein